MFVRSRCASFGSVVAVGFVLVTCGGDKPADNTQAAPAPAPVAAATATPTPAATALPGMSCKLPAVSSSSNSCARESTGDFIPVVDAAIQKVRAEHPSVLDGNTINDLPRFRVEVLKNIEAAGLCGEWDADRNGHRELMVKNSNHFHEQYHIDLSNGQARGGLGGYRSTCTPAGFPVNPQPLAPRGDCKLPSSRDVGCDRLRSAQLIGVMDEIVAEVGRERSDLVDNGYLVGSWNAYHDAIIQKLLARGYCAVFNVTEISVKNTNDYSEQYLMEYSWGQLRKGMESYRATCRPATF